MTPTLNLKKSLVFLGSDMIVRSGHGRQPYTDLSASVPYFHNPAPAKAWVACAVHQPDEKCCSMASRIDRTLLIQTEQAYEQALLLAEQLTFLPVSSPQLTVLYRCLVKQIEAYEAKAFPMASPAVHDILQHLLESSHTSPQQLADLLESPQSVQAILKGQQKLTPDEADRVGQYFQLDPSLFLEG